MATWLLYLVFPLFCLILGIPIALLLGRRSAAGTVSLGGFLFRGIVAGFLLHSAVALVLAELAIFSLVPFLLLEGILGFVLALLLWRYRQELSWPRPAWEDLIPVGLLLLVALLLGEPHPAILGGSDPGSYVGIAANILRVGSLRTQNSLWAAMSGDLARHEFLFANMPGLSMPYHLLPGYYALDQQSGTILPMFYHLYPLWLALSMAVAGLMGGLWIIPILAGWGLVALYYAGRAIVGRWAALAAALLFALNPLFAWLGRHPISEVPAQFLLLCAVYGLVEFLNSDERDQGAGVLAGAAIGGLLHTRVDSVLLLGLVGAWLAFRLFAPGRRWSTLLPFLLPLGIALAHWGLYLAFFTWGYTVDTLGGAFKFLLAPIALPLLGLGIVGFLLLIWLARRDKLTTLLPLIRVALVAAVLLLAGFAWFVWPRIAQPAPMKFYVWTGWQFYNVTESRNFVSLASYLSPLGLVLGLTGFCLFVLRSEVRRAAFLSGLILLYGVLYTYHTAEFPVHPYVMRRYFVVVIPGLVLMAGYLLYRLARSGRIARVVSIVLLVLLLWISIGAARLPWQVDDFVGVPEQLAGLAKSFAPQDVLLFTDVPEGMLLAFPLQYLYQRNSFILQRAHPDELALQRQVEAWWQEGRQVFVLVSSGTSRLSPRFFSLEPVDAWVLHWSQLSSFPDGPPTQVIEQQVRYTVYRLSRAEIRQETTAVDVGGTDYPYLVDGFWGPEVTADGMSFRWTNGDATIELPESWFTSTGPLTLTLDLQLGWTPRQDNRPLEVWLDGVLLGRLNPDLQLREYDLAIPPDLRDHLAGEDAVLLQLRGSIWKPAEDGLTDPRQLGVVVDRITVR